jgi:peptide/nickel transport system substrate-binding protein
MHKRLMGLFAAATIIVAACGASTATQAPASQTPASVAPATEAPPATPAPTAAPVPPDITIAASNYKPEPVGNKGGKLVVGTSGEPNTIWWGIYDNFAATVEGFGPSLWSLWNNTADFKYYGQLAANVPTVANGGVTLVGDGMDVKIDLIPGALWSDGKPITCQDLTDQWKWQMDPTNAGTVTGTQGYEDITSIDGGTGTSCVVHFKKVYEPYLGLWAPLLPMHYVNTVAPADAFTKLYTQADPKSGVYSGPWLPTNWSAGAQIDYVPNPNFWKTIKKADSPFDSYTLRFYSSVDALIAGYTNNEVDVAMEMNHNNLPALAASQVPPADVDVIDGLTYEHNSYNLANLTEKFGADGAKALMEALHYAYDKDAINQRVLGGTATPSCNFTSPLAWSYKDLPCYKTDMAKAEKVLADAGFTKGSDGVLVKNGNPVVLRACTRADRQYRLDTLTLVASQVQPLGIKFDLTNLATDPGILFAGWNDAGSDVPCNLTHGNFEVTEFAWVSTPDPLGIYGVYHSKYDPTTNATHAGSNYIRLHNDTVDTGLDTSLRSVDLLKIKDEFGKIQDLYVDPANGFPEIALYNWRTVLLNNKAKVHNVVNNSTAATQNWNIEDWWRSQ